MLVAFQLDDERPFSSTAHDAPFSPVSRVPPELLIKIFLDVASTGLQGFDALSWDIQDRAEAMMGVETTRAAPPPPPPHTPSHSSCAGPFSISHVCRAWRGLSLALPALWTNLRVINPRTTGIVRLLSLWIERARQRPLSLSLYQSARSPQADQATRSVWWLYLSVMDKWRSLEVDVGVGFDGSMRGVRRPKWAAPLNLETVRLSFGSSANEVLPRRSCDGRLGRRMRTRRKRRRRRRSASEELTLFACVLHSSSPRLRTAHWDNTRVRLQFHLISHFWSTLTELTLAASQDVAGLVFLLSRCKSLQTLTIYRQSHDTYGDALNPPSNTALFPPSPSPSPLYAELPNLHTLTLGTFIHPENLFNRLVVPGIRTLAVLRGRYHKTGWRGLSNAAWASLQEMCRRCGARLAVLTVGGVEVDAAFDEPQWKGLTRCGSAATLLKSY